MSLILEKRQQREERFEHQRAEGLLRRVFSGQGGRGDVWPKQKRALERAGSARRGRWLPHAVGMVAIIIFTVTIPFPASQVRPLGHRNND